MTIDQSIVAEILQVLDTQPGLFDRLADVVTLEQAHRYLAALEATPAPSQTTRWTRVPAVEALLREEGVLDSPDVAWHADLDGTGNAALLLGRNPSRKRVWILTHLDQISYLVDPGDGHRYPLVPLCYHMQVDGQQPALALAYDLTRGELAVRARGVIEVDGSSITFVIRDGEPLVAGTRVVYDSQLEWDRETNCVRGYLDDSAACTAALLAARVLCHYPVDVLIGLTDEEEGPPNPVNHSAGVDDASSTSSIVRSSSSFPRFMSMEAGVTIPTSPEKERSSPSVPATAAVESRHLTSTRYSDTWPRRCSSGGSACTRIGAAMCRAVRTSTRWR